MHIDYLCNHPEFIEELATLNFKEWGDFAPGDSLEARIELMRSACGKGEIPSVVVALEGAELLGGALLIDSDLDLRPELTPWLAGVYVKAGHRGKGVASQLVNRVVAEAAALSVPELYLYTDTSQSLYARLGWQVVEELVYEELPVTVMKFVIQR
ncbi:MULTISPECIES: GNAT family N-acetyltransferase [Pseudomonas]|uniref:GCN5 family acetyltransferase n=1 Tax=Pseudomonas fluorescens TaxID=294 RepID=A0AAE2AU91_PSEFL|nr:MULTISPECIES: GNAT family N-acetyltransferase [Pseudomonas]KIP91640.1 GCN5 family acetyltransferase [Pseudomonas fluorescens]MDR6161372.1 GNAT superfamily N-acetyltransferase [Pseudomonas fluorescens]UVL44423.1 GNAT family N-acetyltransferase [Pseudomonas moraviensis]